MKSQLYFRRFLVPLSFLMLFSLYWAAGDFGKADTAAAAPSASTRYVDPSGSDSGDCTNAGSPCKTINYARTQSDPGDTISLAAGIYVETVNLFQDTTLSGAGVGKSIIDGGAGGSVLTVYSGNVVTASGITFRNGYASWGAGVYNMGTLTITDSEITNNHASDSIGGIYNSSSAVLTATRTTIRDNTAWSLAGGLGNFGTLATVNDSTISGNKASANYAGGVHNNLGSTLNMTNVTVSGNVAPSGAGLSNSGTINLANVTVAFNTATGNFGGGISNYGTVTYFMTIMAHNTGGLQCDGSGTNTSNGYNLSNDASCNFTNTGDLPSTNADLGPLQNYSSWMMTHSPFPGSAVIDAGTNASCPAADQRGKSRPINGGVSSTCDIGAHEYDPATDKPRIFLPIVARDS